MNKILRQRLVFLLFALLTIFFEIAAAPGLINPQEAGWNTPISISSLQATGWFPDIASDSMGRVHVAWAAGTSGFDTILYTSTTDGVNWTKVNDIAAIPQNGTDSAATRPALWVDNNNYLNLSYVSSTLYYSRAPINTAEKASAWAQPLKLNGSQVAYFSRIIQDTRSQFHLFYTENVISNNCKQCYHLFHRVSENNASTWSEPQDISADGTGVAKPQIIVDNKGGIFVVWESGIGGGMGQLAGPSVVKFAASYDFGKTWTESITLSQPTIQEAKDITIGLDGKGSLVTAWLALPDNTVNYQKSADGGKTWSYPIPIEGVLGSWSVYPSKLDDYSITTDSSGSIHLVLIGQLNANQTSAPTQKSPTPNPTQTLKGPTPTPPSQSLVVMHLTWHGDSWSQPEIITKYTGDVPEWPRAMISSGNVLNVVWFVRDQANIWNSDNAHYHIWYARKEINAPAIPTVIPAITFTPTLTAILNITPTVNQPAPAINSLPTLAVDEKLPSKAPYTEYDYVAIFANSLAPTAFLIIAVSLVLLILKRRR